MVNQIYGVGIIPEELSTVDEEELLEHKKHLLSTKRRLQREIDHIDTELIGITEELRKRKDQELAERTFRNAFIEE